MSSPLPHPMNVAAIGGEQRFELLVQAVKDYAIYLLDEHGFVRSWNSGAEHLKGYAADEIIGQHFSVFYTPEDRAVGIPALALRRAREEGKFEAEGWRVKKDGTRCWASVVIDPVYDKQLNFIGFAKVTRDITERKRIQDEIERTREAVHHAQKMEAIGRITGGVAHDFNNLLTVIQSSIEFLRRPDLTEERRTRYLEAISGSADRAAKLTGQLLAFARQQPLASEVFDASDKVSRLRRIMEAMLGATVRTSFQFPDVPTFVRTDPSQFETALINIAVNARDAMPNGGTLSIILEPVSKIPALRGHRSALGNYLKISIRDSGTGIDRETLGRIFDPFFTTKPVDRGTGLGLSQVYGYVKQSGGDVGVESSPGEGSEFSLYLPTVNEESERSSLSDTPKIYLGGKVAKRILLVEDNDLVGRFSVDMLNDMGEVVTWASNATEALGILKQRAHDFDIVFSDVMMPGINGIELAREVRRLWPELRILLTSGYNDVLLDEDSHSFDMLAKPYSIDALTKMLNSNER